MSIAFAFALAWLSDAQASQRIMEPGDDVVIATPYGNIPKYVARYTCGAQYVFVGVVTQVTPRFLVGDRIVSDLQFQAERKLYGGPPTAVTLTVPGGRMGTRTVGTPPEYPKPQVGGRYLMAYSLLKQDSGHWHTGDPIIAQTLWVTPPAELPTSGLPAGADLRAALDDLCLDHNLPRYHDVMGE